MLPEDGYEERFVAFIDILGFKDLVLNIETKTEGYKNDFKRVGSILNFLNEESIESNTQHDLLIYEEKDGTLLEKELGDPRINYISDCVIISTEGSFDGFKSLCNKITKFSTDIACDGIFLRGAITFGPLYHQKPFLFGSAYQKAYELESKISNTPRIIVDDSVFEKLNEYHNKFPLCEPTIRRDTDGVYFMSSFPWNYFPYYTYDWLNFLLRVKGHILYNLNKFDPRVAGFSRELKRLDTFCRWKECYGWRIDFTGGHPKVLAKYEWLKDEFNWTLRKFGSVLSVSSEEVKSVREGFGVKKGMKISPITWKDSYWGPEKELGHYR
jgi:hypothetical protein